MPKLPHEAIVQLFRRAPELLGRLVDDDPPHDPADPTQLVQVGVTELVDLHLAEYRADVVLLRGPPGRPRRTDILEVQGSADPDKRRTWPVQLAGMHARHRCDVYLTVIALDPAVARWCAEAIVLGEGCMVVRPRVIDRAAIPRIIDPEAARAAPELAVLSALAHGDEPGGEEVALAALAAASSLDEERRLVYPDFILAGLPAAARLALDKLMDLRNYEFQSDFARRYFAEGKAEGRAEGKAEGKAELLLGLLRLRGFRPSKRQRERVLACTDETQLETWAARVLRARTLAEVFAPRPAAAT